MIKEASKNNSTPDFSLNVDGVKGVCPAGEKYAIENIAERKIPVLSCERPCIRGEIARLAANIVAKESPYARSCYAETFLAPHSSQILLDPPTLPTYCPVDQENKPQDYAGAIRMNP